MVRLLLKVPVEGGVNVTLIVQLEPEVRVPGQGVVTAYGPEATWLVIPRSFPPVLVNCRESVLDGWVVESFFRLPKSKCEGMILTVPFVSVTETVEVLLVSAIDVAVTLTLALVGTVAGAAYDAVVPLGVSVPQAAAQGVGGGLPWLKLQVAP
jgi:hypothetical protein